jgi:hypothetical protein
MYTALLLVVGLWGQSETAEPVSTPDQRLAFARRAAERYHFAADSQKAALHRQPLLRWDNQVVREDDGMLFLWIEKHGQPLVAAQFFLQGDVWHHEFQSLSEGGFEATVSGVKDWSWQPQRAGIRFLPTDEAESPAKTATARLRQMRAIAEKYSGAVDPDRTGKFESPHELRLLTTPVYRYVDDESEIIDGAIFAFVQGTNPEVLLVLQARSQAGKPRWQLGFAPMTSFQLRVRRGEKVVFERELQKVPTLDLKADYHFRWAAEKDHSAEVKLDSPPAAGK